MPGICEGRVVVVTGAGRGIGRAHALAYAGEGAKVVVNDLGVALDGTGSSSGPAGEVVDEIRAMGGEAVANGDDVADFDGAGRLIRAAIDTFGSLDVLVNNAGIIRDRMLVNLDVDEWDAVTRVHLRGTFGPTKHAASYWRERSKAGDAVDGRVINTSSYAGLFGNIGQTHYSAAKAGIASFTRVAAAELGRYGVTVNAIAPTARTRMTENLPYGVEKPEEGFDVQAPENVSPLVVWLGSPESRDVTGQVFMLRGGVIEMALNWQRGPKVEQEQRWEPSQLGGIVKDLVARMPELPKVLGS
ncbi:MAG TPA: SDR family oxidoreductase [Acidimicrobiia bacterium]|jgi:NAD(P)-dependent dehydrogenase (short-subunit alcohol dehydrogenase family)|nr:SDR family oxidoreductase [Acidimicrobiia bacterium]